LTPVISLARRIDEVSSRRSAFRQSESSSCALWAPAGAKPRMLRRALIEAGVPYQCACCGIPGVWQDQMLILHVDHINGNYLDCRPENVHFLCPNCHSQTASWAGKNKNVRSYSLAPSIRPIVVEEILTLFDDTEPETLAS
jgi:hypothetical protein